MSHSSPAPDKRRWNSSIMTTAARTLVPPDVLDISAIANTSTSLLPADIISQDGRGHAGRAADASAYLESRKRALDRLQQYRHKDMEVAEKRAEEEHVRDISSRLQWREGVKDRRRGELSATVDRLILESTVRRHPRYLQALHGALAPMSEVSSTSERAALYRGLDLESREEQKSADASSTDMTTQGMHSPTATATATATATGNKDERGMSAGQRFLERVLKAESLLSLDDGPEQRSLLDKQSGKLVLEPRSTAGPETAEAEGIEPAAAPEPEKPAAMLLHPPESVPTLQLADCLFLAGPTQADLEALVDKQLAGLAVPTSRRRSNQMVTPPRGMDSPNPSGEKDFPPFSDRVEPRMLYSTSKDPDLDADLLPYFCFPSGVQVNATPGATDRDATRRPSVAALALQQTSPGMNPKKKGGGGGDGRKAGSGKQNTAFSFLLSNHVSTQYGLCLQIPRTVTLPARGTVCPVTVHVVYCICVVTRFPFLGHLLHALAMFEQHGGLDVPDGGDCIRQCEASRTNVPAELRLLAELASSLDRLHVPIYPRMAASGSSSSLTEGALSLSALAAIPLSYDPVTLTFPVKGARRIEIVFARDGLQRFYLLNAGVPADRLPVGLHVDVDDPRALGHLQRATGSRDHESVYYTLLWALPILLKHLPLDQVILAVGCALSEMKIVVLSPDPNVVSGCLLALVHLLRPLRWAGNVVVTLPAFLNELLESPSFFFLGMERLPDDFEMTPGLVVVDPQKHEVHLHPTDIVASHTINVPQSTQLLAQLKKHAEVISHNGRRRRSVSIGDHTPTISQRAASVRVLGPDGKEVPIDSDISLAQPCELDPDSSTGNSTATAVKEFARIFREHLKALVDTALKAMLDARAAEKALKRAGAGLAKNGKGKPAGMGSASERIGTGSKIQTKRGGSSSSSLSASSEKAGGAVAGFGSGTGKSTVHRPANIREEIGLDGSDADEERKRGGGDADIDGDSDGEGRGTSVSSTASVPFLSPGAHIFTSKEIGDSGTKFIRRLRETQSFSNHCFEHTEQGRRRHTEETLAEFSARAQAIAIWKQMGPSRALGSGGSGLVSAASFAPRDARGLANANATDARRMRAVQTMFTTILTGTCPLTDHQVMSLRTAYSTALDTLTSNAHFHLPEDLLGGLPAVSDYALSLYPLSQEGAALSMLTRAEMDGGILWCNGRCGGLADSPQCTSICLVLWARRVQASRQRQELKRIVQRHHTSGDAVLTALTLPSGEIVKLRPRAPPVKHPKETDAQFRLRMQEVLGLPMQDVDAGARLWSSVEPVRLATNVASARAGHGYGTNYSEAKKPSVSAATVTTSAIAESSHDDDCPEAEYLAPSNIRSARARDRGGPNGSGGDTINAFVRHYAHQRYKALQRRRQDAAMLLSVPLSRWIRTRRNRVYSQAATVINSCIRGYLVRMNEEQLGEILTARKLERLLACLRLRKWLRSLHHETFQRWRNGDWRHLWGHASRFGSPCMHGQNPINTLIFSGSEIIVRITSWKCRIFGVKVTDLYDTGKPGSPQDPTVVLTLQQDGDRENASGKPSKKPHQKDSSHELGRTARRKHAGVSCSFLEEFSLTLEEGTADWYLKAEVSHENYLGGLTHIGMGCLPLGDLMSSVGDERGDMSPLSFMLENGLPQARTFIQIALPLEHRPHSRWRGSGTVSGSGSLMFSISAEPQYELPLALKAKATLQRNRLTSASSDIDVFSMTLPQVDEPPSPYHSVQGIIGSFFQAPKTPRDSIAAAPIAGTVKDADLPVALAPGVLSTLLSTTEARRPTGHIVLGRKDSLQSVLSDVTEGTEDESGSRHRASTSPNPNPNPSAGMFGSFASAKPRSTTGRVVSRHRSDLTQDMLALKKEKVLAESGAAAAAAAADHKSVTSPLPAERSARHADSDRPRSGSSSSNASSSTSVGSGSSPPTATASSLRLSSFSSSPSTCVTDSTAPAPLAEDSRYMASTNGDHTALLASASSPMRSPLVPPENRSSSPTPKPRSPPRVHNKVEKVAPLPASAALTATVAKKAPKKVSAGNDHEASSVTPTQPSSRGGGHGGTADGEEVASAPRRRSMSGARSQSPARPRNPLVHSSTATTSTVTSSTEVNTISTASAAATATATAAAAAAADLGDRDRASAEEDVFVAVSPKSRLGFAENLSLSHPSVEAEFDKSKLQPVRLDRVSARTSPGGDGGEREGLDITVSVKGRSSRAGSEAEEPAVSERLPGFLLGLTGSQVAGAGAFTVQQVDMLCTMYDLLRAGVEVIKHGKSGDPRERMLYCDQKLSILYWMHRSGKEGRLSEHERAGVESDILERLDKDTAQGGTASAHTGLFGFKKVDSDRMISLREVVDIRDDIETDIMKRSLRKGYVVRAARRGYGGGGGGFTSAGGSKVVSVLGVSRSLDVEIASADYARLFHALQVLINYHRARRLDDETEDTSYRF